jgi:pectin methylesterase-like acyl-CoA thioesterase
VDTATGNDANGGTSFADAKKTIQAAVTQVSASGTVHVNPGTYTENVNIPKAMTIQGAQFGVDARGARGPESIVVPAASGTATFLVAFNGLMTIDGFSSREVLLAPTVSSSRALGRTTTCRSLITASAIIPPQRSG